MNILVIGNGFDLAHKLPTTYKDFLKFIQIICKLENERKTVSEFERGCELSISKIPICKFNQLNDDVAKYIDLIIRDDNCPQMPIKDILERKGNSIINEMITLAKNNRWISYFKSVSINNNWIDFELEISRVVQRFEEIYKSILHEKSKEFSAKDIELLKLFKNNSTTYNELTISDLMNYKEVLTRDLESLIRCLELYLEDCVRNIDKSLISPDIYDLKVDKVLSFNYTDTYARLYSCKNRNIEYDYIHGKSKIDKKSDNNMVLGIDEYLNDDERNCNTDFIEFKKYFQRIHKGTGCIYKKWIEEINQGNSTEYNVHIFGHSLDYTDKDVLKELITNSRVKTYIYYKDVQQNGRQIANLVKLLEQDKLISMVYGNTTKIKFVMQKKMLDKKNSEWQILNDINSLWNLYKLRTSEANALIERLEQKVNERDLHYFNNQEKVISLYDSLVSNIGCDEGKRENLLEIAYSLFNEDGFTVFSADDWANADYSGISPCNNHVYRFINDINSYNMHTKNCYKTLSDFNINNLVVLYNQIDKCIIDEQTFSKLFDCLFIMFDNNDSNVKLIWQCIFKLVEKIPNDKWAEFIKNNLLASKTDIIKHNRFRHIQDVIDEEDFYNRLYEEMIGQEDNNEICTIT